MFCWAFLLLVFTGPGALALDSLFASRTSAPSGHRDESRPETVTA